MKTITKYLALGSAITALVAGSFVATSEAGPHPWGRGPGGPGGPGGKGNPLDHLTRELGLTEAQQKQIQPILDAAKPQAKAIHDDAMAKMKALMQDTIAKIQPVLTPEQQEEVRVHLRRMERRAAERKAEQGK